MSRDSSADREDAAAASNDPAAFTQPAGSQTLQLKVGGMSCSFCVASINKAFMRMDGVEEASVNLAHEEALVRYRPDRITPARLRKTLLDLGYVVRDADKVRSFEEEESELRRERDNLLFSAMLANVFVFTNGVTGMGPLGFQPDVFDAPPGRHGYSPLRKVNLVTWNDAGSARILKSAQEVAAATDSGDLRVERPGGSGQHADGDLAGRQPMRRTV
jgi:copper chaperone CopZ